MKELSIEEKAKRYDNLLVRLQEAKVDNDVCDERYCCVIDDIVPELKKKEDQRIRKGLIAFLEELSRLGKNTNFDKWSKSDCADWIVWLEKQGEQKRADEPKFKVDDWIVRELDNTCHKIKKCILNVTTNKYGYDLTSGGYISSQDANFYHLWTIQDTKAGDVLYLQKDGKEHIIIYKGVIKERFRTFVSAYCAYNGIVDAFCFADVSRYVDIAYGGIMPATKEQRDLLFQKMKEAGYEWNAEKKELNKIEQESEERSEEDKEMIAAIMCSLDGEKLKRVWGKQKEDVKNWLKSPRHQKQWKPSEAQIKAVRLARAFVTDDFSDNPTLSEELMELEEQLKKL